MAVAAAVATACSSDEDGSDATSASEPDSYLNGMLATWWSAPRAIEVNGRTFASGVSPTVYSEPFDVTSGVIDEGAASSVIEHRRHAHGGGGRAP